MKRKLSTLLGLLSIMIFILSTANSVHAVAATATITVGKAPYNLAYDSDKGEIFVANRYPNTVSVLSDSSGTSGTPASSSPSVPEFSTATFILAMLAMVAVTSCAIALTGKKSKRISHASK